MISTPARRIRGIVTQVFHPSGGKGGVINPTSNLKDFRLEPPLDAIPESWNVGTNTSLRKGETR